MILEHLKIINVQRSTLNFQCSSGDPVVSGPNFLLGDSFSSSLNKLVD